ncbi:unnamed protein product [Hanseniaspora opuntiae]|jgi:hypothetical protein|uniref:Uncharacterized protein n=1 Tax=Hanseniaspora opuntiae TaxID=211096 RepID=A0A1E5RMF4_9ASCO|nr:hypothetical protein AWRI3578_g1746 [Hanseniaspora opuntiae]
MQHNVPPSTPVKGTKYQKLNNNHRSQSAQASKSQNNTGYSMGALSSEHGLITPQTVSRFKNTQSSRKKPSSQQTPKPKNSGNSFHLNTASKRMLQTPQNNDEDIREKLLTDMFLTPNLYNPTTPVVKLNFDSESDNDLPHTPKNKIMTFEDAENLHNKSSNKNLTNKNKTLISEHDDDEIYIRKAVLKNPFLSDDSSSDENNKVKKKLEFK